MRRAPAIAALALGCAVAAAAAGTGPYLTETNPALPPRQLLRRTIREREREILGDPVAPRPAPWWETGLEVLLLVALAVGVGYALWRFVRLLSRLAELRLRPSVGGGATEAYDPGEESHDDAETVLRRRVADELTALSADLDDVADPRDAVIACYVRMERAFAEAGTGRAPTESPMELLARVLDRLAVPEADVRRLTALFSEARFSAHPVTEEMRNAARRSLRNVADALAVRA